MVKSAWAARPLGGAVGGIEELRHCRATALQFHVHRGAGKFVHQLGRHRQAIIHRQDQLLDRVDFDNLRARLRQNSVAEKLADEWLAHVLAGAPAPLPHV